MSQRELTPRHKRRISLSVRVSMLLMLAAILPLFVIVASSELLSIPTLTSQANTAMESDARTRTQLIDTYFTERLLDIATLSQVPTVQQFLAQPQDPLNRTHGLYALEAGIFRDKHYAIWSLFDTHGHPLLSLPIAPQPHGQYLVPPAYLQAVTAGKTFISAVYYDPKKQKALVDMYAPIYAPSPKILLGFIRAELNIDYIWGIVNSDRGANGNGSYAFILDENGVRIADTDPARLFSAVAPLSTQLQAAINKESRYGSNKPVPVLPDAALATIKQDTPQQMTPAGQNELFQVTRHATSVLPWSYFVLSPVSTVTAVANQQLLTTIGIALAVLVLAAIVGVTVGRRISRPILSSVENLRDNSQTLNTLATKQQSAANEQIWVVDSSQVGLQSVQYYTDATRAAAHRLGEIGTELGQRWYQLDAQTAKGALSQMIRAANYIEQAAYYQSASNQKLATAIKVTTQVTEQLAAGATSASDAATQLEEVVNQLRDVVGK